MSIHRTHRLLLAAGSAGPALFVASYAVNGALRPGYQSWHDTISVLALASGGWIQVMSFLLYGVLTVCFAVGVRRAGAAGRAAYALLIIAGAGLIVAGLFPTDPILGFPAGEPSVVTPRGTLHNLGALAAMLGLPAAALVTARRPLQGWDGFSIAAGVLSLAAVALFFVFVSAAPNGEDSFAGLFERLPTLFMGLWQIALAVRILGGRSTGHPRVISGGGAAVPSR
ncbi:hypothetical protein GCM10010149_76620 [Nonomuraea roseoviolacea subsp. roseoviolacea]|uniref:Membrane protein n=1 Tax=Nonomuraea roseoviolacea subsp. carminata TaxID=160689 RepID=A0ABT1KEG0_9ACTN|nr:DUF998 domain-containing protein [Nonomuraea roseoviolacea]MCP2351741.1 putative membrane protein [Nonomuraea roseoviolacea subsp. carminata]